MLSRQLLVTFARSKFDNLVFGLGLGSGERLISLSWKISQGQVWRPLLRGARIPVCHDRHSVVRQQVFFSFSDDIEEEEHRGTHVIPEDHQGIPGKPFVPTLLKLAMSLMKKTVSRLLQDNRLALTLPSLRVRRGKKKT